MWSCRRTSTPLIFYRKEGIGGPQLSYSHSLTNQIRNCKRHQIKQNQTRVGWWKNREEFLPTRSIYGGLNAHFVGTAGHGQTTPMDWCVATAAHSLNGEKSRTERKKRATNAWRWVVLKNGDLQRKANRWFGILEESTQRDKKPLQLLSPIQEEGDGFCHKAVRSLSCWGHSSPLLKHLCNLCFQRTVELSMAHSEKAKEEATPTSKSIHLINKETSSDEGEGCRWSDHGSYGVESTPPYLMTPMAHVDLYPSFPHVSGVVPVAHHSLS